ncbi:chitin recognition protein [Colletotrichum simmondsii]|uniref:Chitin recognition protein n=1 Tax=Colletotrichum simmondsii TaxID=703756 RepID=A0A135SF08_9PEZI|nr:chitin recognition protein [Colletotrichum simmondsii]
MRWTPVVLATLAGLQAAHAHDEDEVPQPNMVLPRLRDVDELRQRRNAFEPWNPPTVANKPRADRVKLSPRQTSSIPLGDNSQCGGTYGRCADGYCCSASGWCGQSEEYCASPDCQINYGPACDGNEKPNGPDTSNYARPKNGDIPYGGVGIYACVNQGDVAITYDDGPYIYTAAMLDAFKAHGAVATWFITGNNIGKGMINVNYRDVITRMIADGHQVASHTWSHENLDQMTLAQRKNQMVYNEIAFMDILGFFPTYMRPPYSICGAECQGQMADLGYHITYFDLDTQGYLHTPADQIQFSVNLWDQAMLARTPCNGSYLHIEHDIHQYIATTLTNHILDSVVANGWNAVTVGTCLGDPPENWYRGAVPAYNFKITPVSSKVCSSTSSSSSSTKTSSSSTRTSSATSTSTAVSTNGQCGSTVGFTCQGSAYGNCCSGAGWCGSSSVYCGTSCQSKYGTCGSSASNTTSSSSSGTSSGRTSSSSSTRSGTSSSGSSSRTGTSSSSSRTGTSSSSSRTGTSSSSSRTGTSSSSTRSGSSSSSNTRSSSGSSSGTGTASASSSAASSTSTLPVSTGGDCGAASGKQCFGSTFGNCCSVYNYCGSTDAHCGTGCQSAFGTCNSTSSASGSSSSSGASSSGAASSSGSAIASGTSSASAVLPSTSLISTDGSCGAAAGKSCTGSTFGTCCSVYNYCGTTDAHCGTGCQPGYGSCNGTTAASSSGAAAGGSSSSAATPASSGAAGGSTTANAAAATNTNISKNGECAGTNGYNCLGSNFGDCCSPYNYCGNTTAHCDTGCQSGFGKCSGTGVNVAVSLNGNCGSTNGGSTCAGSTFGNCCSAYGYCGSTSAFCGTGCQSGYGTCDTSSGSGTTAATPAATSAAASTVKTVSTIGAACGSAANAKCGDGFCCTALNVCASSKLLLITNPACYAAVGCQTSWSSSCA